MPLDPSFWHGLTGAAAGMGAGPGGVAQGFMGGLNTYQQSQMNAMHRQNLAQEAAQRRLEAARQAQQRKAMDAYIQQLESSGDPLAAQKVAQLRAIGSTAIIQNPSLFDPRGGKAEVHIKPTGAYSWDPYKQEFKTLQTFPGGGGASPMTLAEQARTYNALKDDYGREFAAKQVGLPPPPPGAGTPSGGMTKTQQWKQGQQDQRYRDSIRLMGEVKESLQKHPLAGYENMRQLEGSRRGIEGWAALGDKAAQKLGMRTKMASRMRELAVPGVTEYMVKTGKVYNNLKALMTDETRLTDKDRLYLNSQLQLVNTATTPDTVTEALDILLREVDIALQHKASGGTGSSVGPGASTAPGASSGANYTSPASNAEQRRQNLINRADQ